MVRSMTAAIIMSISMAACGDSPRTTIVMPARAACAHLPDGQEFWQCYQAKIKELQAKQIKKYKERCPNGDAPAAMFRGIFC